MFPTGHCINWEVLKNYKDFIENNKIINHVAQSIINGKAVVNPE